MNSKHFKVSLTGIAYLGRLAMPRAYSPTMKLSCCDTEAKRWTDYGRMRWHKPRCWRVFLRSVAVKPPRTNRGVSHRILNALQCLACGELLIRHYITDEYGNPFCDAECQDKVTIPF